MLGLLVLVLVLVVVGFVVHVVWLVAMIFALIWIVAFAFVSPIVLRYSYGLGCQASLLPGRMLR